MAVPKLRSVDQSMHPGVANKRQLVRVRELHVDPSYQRGLSQPRISAMARNWDPLLADEIKVSMRKDGSLWLIDGQHRMNAAMLAGVEELFAMVMTGLSPEQEADLFVRGTKQRKGFNSLEEWRAALSAGYADIVEINTLVESIGGRVNTSPNGAKGINAPSALSDVYRLGGTELLGWTLTVIRDAWGSLDGPNVSAFIVKGLGLFLGMYADLVDTGRLTEQMRRAGVTELGRKSNAYRAIRGPMGETRVSAIYYAFVDIYNYNLRESNGLPNRRPNRRDIALEEIGGGRKTTFGEVYNPKSMERADGI